MAILFVASEAGELNPFAERLSVLKKLNWPIDFAAEGVLEGRRVLLAANGAGPTLAAQAVETAIRAVMAADLSSSRLEAVVSTGYCGALQTDMHPGSILLPARVREAETGELFDCNPLGLPGQMEGTLLCQNRIANSAAEKLALGGTGAFAVDMESAGVARRAKRAGLPFSCIKVVTDRVDESFGLDLNTMRSQSGRISHGKIVCYALTHPVLMPELFRLRRRAKDAASALGEFLVSNRIRIEGQLSPAEGSPAGDHAGSGVPG